MSVRGGRAGHLASILVPLVVKHLGSCLCRAHVHMFTWATELENPRDALLWGKVFWPVFHPLLQNKRTPSVFSWTSVYSCLCLRLFLEFFSVHQPSNDPCFKDVILDLSIQRDLLTLYLADKVGATGTKWYVGKQEKIDCLKDNPAFHLGGNLTPTVWDHGLSPASPSLLFSSNGSTQKLSSILPSHSAVPKEKESSVQGKKTGCSTFSGAVSYT